MDSNLRTRHRNFLQQNYSEEKSAELRKKRSIPSICPIKLEELSVPVTPELTHFAELVAALSPHSADASTQIAGLQEALQRPAQGLLGLVRASNLLEVSIYLLQESDEMGLSVEGTCDLLGLISTIFFLDKQASKEASNVYFFGRLWSFLQSRHLPTAIWVG